ncbi:G1 family glutamic endopeptidase [Candidatus Clostridium radicumherbarum]|uniref:G1 family glutamic endopeptidase n=1 Tax=Candidatus Clostridium radicumherbarum TaxID=3381662 RepID=A0ABW8TR43_9CLOT
MYLRKRCLSIILVATLVATSIFNSQNLHAQNNTNSKDKEENYSEIRKLPDGGEVYVYNINGVENDFPIPPKGFIPMNATDEQLLEYGFPARPKDKNELLQWEDMMKHYKNTPIPKIISTQIKHGLKRKENYTIKNSVNNQLLNWSGYVDYVNSNTLRSVQGDFTQPTEKSDSVANAYESSWIGIGGVNTAALLQAGTAMHNYQYTAFYEYIDEYNNDPNGQINIASINISPGDDVHMYVTYLYSNRVANFYVADYTNGGSQSIFVNLDNNYYDGSTVEWIDERPTLKYSDGTKAFANLADFGTISWFNCKSYNSSNVWNDLTSLSHQYVSMWSTGGKYMLASPNTPYSSTNFYDVWLNAN